MYRQSYTYMPKGTQHFRDNIGSIRRVRTPDSSDARLSDTITEKRHDEVLSGTSSLSGRALFIKSQYQTEAGQSYIYHKPLRHQPISHEKDTMPRGKNSARGEFVQWLDKTTAKGVKLSRDPLP